MTARPRISAQAVVWSAEDDMYIPKQTREGDADAEPHENMLTSRNYYRFSRGLNSRGRSSHSDAA